MEGSKNSIFRKYYGVLFLLISAIIIKVITFFPSWIEHQYLPFVYNPVSAFMRILFGWLPFSVGDIFYGLIIGLLILNLYKLIRRLTRRRFSAALLRSMFLRLLVISLGVYVYFNISWGLNYNRLGIAYQLALEPQKYSVEDLKMITAALIPKVNNGRNSFKDSIISIPPYKTVFKGAAVAYNNAYKQYSFLSYGRPSVKKSYYGRAGNYLGFLGYYNPFTGEAQVNLTIPRFTIPYVTCHEIAHQLGYASESEASFVGYLTAVRSDDILYRYSAYFDMFVYSNTELARMDTVAAKANFKKLDKRVQGDYYQVRDFQKRTRNPLESIIEVFYDFYLKANQQEKGVKSYNEVVGWLVAYKKKYGFI